MASAAILFASKLIDFIIKKVGGFLPHTILKQPCKFRYTGYVFGPIFYDFSAFQNRVFLVYHVHRFTTTAFVELANTFRDFIH